MSNVESRLCLSDANRLVERFSLLLLGHEGDSNAKS